MRRRCGRQSHAPANCRRIEVAARCPRGKTTITTMTTTMTTTIAQTTTTNQFLRHCYPWHASRPHLRTCWPEASHLVVHTASRCAQQHGHRAVEAAQPGKGCIDPGGESPRNGESRPESGRTRPRRCRFRAKCPSSPVFGRNRPYRSRYRAMLADVSRTCHEFGLIWPESKQPARPIYPWIRQRSGDFDRVRDVRDPVVISIHYPPGGHNKIKTCGDRVITPSTTNMYLNVCCLCGRRFFCMCSEHCDAYSERCTVYNEVVLCTTSTVLQPRTLYCVLRLLCLFRIAVLCTTNGVLCTMNNVLYAKNAVLCYYGRCT